MRGRRKGWRHAGALHRDWQREIVVWEYFNQGAQWGFGKGNKVLRLLYLMVRHASPTRRGSLAALRSKMCAFLRQTSPPGRRYALPVGESVPDRTRSATAIHSL